MKKYGFDYYIKRGEILSEMARKSKLLTSPGGLKMGEYIREVSKVIRLGGKIEDQDIKTGETVELEVPGYSGNPQNRVLKYIVNTILDFDNISPKFGEEEVRTTLSGREKIGSGGKDDTVSGALKILGITDKTLAATGMSSNDLFSKAIAKWSNENEDKVMSDEFKNKILDPQNILFYLKNNRSSPHNIGRLKDERLKEIHGASSVEEVHSAAQKIRPLITKIHRMQMAELMRKNPSITSDKIINQDTFNITYILYTLESYMALLKVIKKILGINFEKSGVFNISDAEKIRNINDGLENPLPEIPLLSLASFQIDENGESLLNRLYDDFEIFIDEGINREDFELTMKDFIEFSGAPPENIPLLRFLLTDLLPTTKTSNEFPGYFQHILDEVLGEDPENWEAFSKYYDWKENEKYRLSQEMEKRSSSYNYDEYKGFLPEVRRGYQEFLNKWKKIHETRSLNYAKSLKVDKDDNYLYPELQDTQKNIIDDEIEDLKKGIKFATSGNVMDDIMKRKKDKRYSESNNSYVMNYMTEQISKDRFSPKGEFKDRGIRKLNYLEWLDRNS